ncbi:MAG TPA: methylated-DNA--[protein]-cysteine S-methyltransferase [Thermoanaerobaculia bacterium]|nr:methylated-DNA--[protein]-cysteine S-methyltransferase [Thermoanaerobaculia bacterium]
MRCKSVLMRIDALRTGELPEAEKSVVEEHLSDCTSCDESTHDLAELSSLAKELLVPPARSCASSLKETLHDSFGRFQFEGRTIWVTFNPRGIRAITTGEMSGEEFRRSRPSLSPDESEVPANLREPIERVLRGVDPGDVPLDLAELTDFEKTVLAAIRKIPRGEVRPYRWVAREIGRPKAIRAVGNVMARNPIPLILPCHRVVPNGGGVGNYGWGPAVKRGLLKIEGVAVDELDALARRGIRFIGSKTTRIYCFPTCRDAKRIRPENQVAIRDEGDAETKGFRPCRHCRPASLAS